MKKGRSWRAGLAAVAGSLFLIYFIILKLVEPGRPRDFSLFWLFAGSICLAHFIFDTRIRQYFAYLFSRWKILRPLLLTLVAVFLAVNGGILWYIITPTAGDAPQPKYLLVLGGGIRKKGEPSRTLASRLDTSIEYAKAHPDAILIVTGGQGVGMPESEARAMERYLVGKGRIAATRILKEERSLDTIQNLAFCRTLILDREGTVLPVAILTSDYHLKRALLLARLSGYTDCAGIAAPTEPLFIPNNYTREIAAWWKLGLRMVLRGRIRV